jgi:hypothetical protein
MAMYADIICNVASDRNNLAETFRTRKSGVGASHGNLPHVKNFGNQVTLCWPLNNITNNTTAVTTSA